MSHCTFERTTFQRGASLSVFSPFNPSLTSPVTSLSMTIAWWRDPPSSWNIKTIASLTFKEVLDHCILSWLFSYEKESTWTTTTLPSNCAFPPSLPAGLPSGKYNVVGFFFHEKSIISFSPSSWKVYTASSEFVTFQTLYAQPMTSPVINDNVYGIIQSGWPRTASSSGGETQPFVPWSIFHQFRKLTKSHLVDQD